MEVVGELVQTRTDQARLLRKLLDPATEGCLKADPEVRVECVGLWLHARALGMRVPGPAKLPSITIGPALAHPFPSRKNHRWRSLCTVNFRQPEGKLKGSLAQSPPFRVT